MKINLKKISLLVLGVALICGSYLLQAGDKGKYEQVKSSTANDLFTAINAADLQAVQDIENIKKLLSKTNANDRTAIQHAASLAKDFLGARGMYMTPSESQKYTNWLLIINYLLEQGAKEKDLKNFKAQLNAAKALKNK